MLKLISCGFNMDTAHRIKDEMQAPRTWKSTPSQKDGVLFVYAGVFTLFF